MHHCHSVPNFIALRQMTWEKTVTKMFYTLKYFGTTGEPSGPKFTNNGTDVQQDPDYQCAKFSHLLTTCLQDICRWTLMISLKQTDKKPKRYVFAYHAETTKQQVVKVNWNKAASLPQMDGSNIYARWRQCALPWEQIGATWWILMEHVLPSAHPSPQPKWQIDHYSHFCTAHGRKCLHFTMGAPFPKNYPFP